MLKVGIYRILELRSSLQVPQFVCCVFNNFTEFTKLKTDLQYHCFTSQNYYCTYSRVSVYKSPFLYNSGEKYCPSSQRFTKSTFDNFLYRTRRAVNTCVCPVSRPFPLSGTSAFSSNSRDLHLVENMAENKYSADYAKTARSSCKKCKQKIEKGELRMAKVVSNFFHEGEGDMKQYHHAACLFETFVRARATTKIIEEPDDVQGFTDLEEEDRATINQLIKDTLEKKGSRKATTPKKAATVQTKLPGVSKVTPKKENKQEQAPAADSSSTQKPSSATASAPGNESADKDNSFRQFRRLCADIAEENSYTGKTKLVANYLARGNSGDGFQGDVYLLLKLLLPGVVKIIYNMNSKQLVKIFSQIFGTSLEEMIEDLEQGDVAETVKIFFEQSKLIFPLKKSNLTLKMVDDMLTELSQYTKEDDQQKVLTKIAKRSTANDLKLIVRLIKHDLRINSGAKHILDALDPNAHEAFKASRDLKGVVDKVLKLREDSDGKPGLSKKLSIRASVMTPISPMLAEACKSVEQAFKKCPNGMYAEIKYDGERVQVHKQGEKFEYFSRSLKPVLPHKVQHFKDYIPKAFPHGNDIILDSEVLLIDTKTSKPLPFGSLGVHKKQAFQDANVCLFVFDCIHYNGENLMDKPIKQRRKILRRNMTEIPNRILFSEMEHITETGDLKSLMMKVFREGLEGLVLKDVNSIYEPGKRHWLKVKKDYLAEGAMADTADLVVLGAYFGTGSKGGIMSIFLMGVHNPRTGKWCTTTKCGSGFDDKTLDKLQKELDMIKISKDYSKVPKWLNVSKTLVPDFVAKDPKKSPVWEITGAEFSKSDSHTSDGISIRFPRCTKMRDDKSWEEATDLPRLKVLFEKSKECSDMKDVLKTPSPTKGKAAKSKPDSDEEDNMDVGDVSNSASPIKKAAKRRAESDEDSSPTKKVKKSPCKYGANCYQKSAEHRSKFSHPDSAEDPSKTKVLPEVFRGMTFHLPKAHKHYKVMKRYIIAYNGDLTELDKNQATHIVMETNEDDDGSGKCVTSDWVLQCIKKKQLVPYSKPE